MHDGQPMGDAADDPGSAVLVRQALAIVVELAGSSANDRLPRLVRAAQGLTGADAVAVAVVGPDGRFLPGGASSEAAARLLAAELSAHLGPTITCRNQGRPVAPSRLATWPGLAGEAKTYGLSTVDSVPLRTADQVMGALTFYWSVPSVPSRSVQDLTQALADITAIGLAHDKAVHGHRQRAEQMENALPSRVVIEQAKGFLAARHRITVDEAYSVLRAQAQSGNRAIPDVAADIVGRRPGG